MKLVPAANEPVNESLSMRIPTLTVVGRPEKRRILDFDLETLAAGFADPNWVPQKIMCASWGWLGDDRTPEVRVCGPMGFFKDAPRRRMLAPLIKAIHEADMLIGHNIVRFDLPILNAECLRLGFGPLPEKLVHDTMNLVKTKGFKKGQDVLAGVLGVASEKQAMNWHQWQEAYAEDGWRGIKSRCVKDVIQHKEMYGEIKPWLRPAKKWKP
jgi:DNA polymerase elongation subunit (family B)